MAKSLSSSSARGEWLIQTWETDDGLPENSATAMVQDSDGYLWFGTFKGLVRFDGDHFTVLDRSTTPELPSDGIVNLHLDRANRLWVSTLAGLVVRRDGKWHLVRRSETPNDFIRTFAERANGDLLLTSFDGKVHEFANGQLKELTPPPGQSGGGYLGAVDEDGRWWVTQRKFTGRWDGKTWQPMVSLEELSTAAPGTLAIAPARDGSIWLLLNSQLRKYSHGVEVIRRDLLESPGDCWSMMEDSRSNVWICTTQQGVCQILPDGQLLRWEERNGLSYHSTRFVFEDREKNLWIGTSGGGLQRFKRRRFKSFGPDDGLTERVVKSVALAHDGGVWIGTYGSGLFRWTDSGITNVPVPGWTRPHLYVQSVICDTKGRTWAGIYGLGLFVLDGEGCRIFPPEQVGGDNGLALFEDSKGRIWTSSGQAIAMFEPEDFRIHKLQGNARFEGVCCFAEDSDKTVWFSNQSSVHRLENDSNDSIVEVKDGNGRPLSGIVCLRADPGGVMWMGSIGAGLLRWKKGQVSAIGTDKGLAAPNVHGILEDQQGYFWMASNRGVLRAARSDLQSVADGTSRKLVSQLFDLSDGLPSVECPSGQQPTCGRDANGRLWFATMKGIAMTAPADFSLNTAVPAATIQAVSYFTTGQDVRNAHLNHRSEAPFKKLELPASSHGIEIHYTAPSFASPQKVKFQIKIDGDDEWWDVGPRRVAYFEELKPGWHLFQVRAANDDGIWGESGATLAFTVLPLFWQTTWFRCLLVAALCGLVLAAIYRLKTNLERKHAAQESFTRQLILSQENERRRVASELHDGLGQDLLIVKNRLKLLSERVGPEVASQLQDISKTTSEAIAEVRAISHALRPSALEQVGLTKALEWMVDQVAQSTPAKFSVHLENIDGVLSPDMEINLFRIVQEALNNIIKHSSASEVILELGKEPAAVVLSVFDNGRGFDIESVHGNGDGPQGFGLNSMSERAKVLGGHLELWSAKGTGTRMTLRLPMAKLGK